MIWDDEVVVRSQEQLALVDKVEVVVFAYAHLQRIANGNFMCVRVTASLNPEEEITPEKLLDFYRDKVLMKTTKVCSSHGEYDIRDEDGNCPTCLAIGADFSAGAE